MESMFKFKQFNVSHGKSSMKVGVDAVLLGAWAGELCEGKIKRILDVGSGCGVIALILGQKFQQAIVIGMDCDENSVSEATDNFTNSPWSDRLSAYKCRFPDFPETKTQKYDLIVSNPPYFSSGIAHPVTSREIARHQGSLSMFTLLDYCGDHLTPHGRISMIYPFEYHEKLIKYAAKYNMIALRECKVRNNESRPFKRIMAEFVFNDYGEVPIERSELTLFQSGEPTPAYRELCRNLYLKF